MFGAHDVPDPGREQGGPGAWAQRSHPNHPKPEVVARAPNEAWSWDITRLLGPEKWQYFYLYVIPGHLQPLRQQGGWWRSGRPQGWPDA